MKTLRFLRLLSRSLSVVRRVALRAAIVGPFSLRWRDCARGIAAALMLGAVTAHAAIAPLPPLPEPFPETLPTDQFAVEVPEAVVAQAPDEDMAWLTPATMPTTSAPAPAPDATPALEGPPTPLPPIERMSRAPADQAAAPLDDGKPISLNLKNADLSAVLQTFAKFSGVNIVASEKIRGVVSLNLVDVPWRRAFDTLLDVHGLAMERHGEVIWVAPLSELAARVRLRYEAHARAADLEPLASRTFVLRYPRADDVRKLLTGSASQRVLSKRGSVMADARTNLLFVTDLEARVTQIAELIARIDQPTPQVMIEARIVEGDTGFSRNLGVKLSMTPTGDATARGLVAGADGAVFDLSARPIGGFDAATAGLTLFAAQATRLLNVELSALENEGRGQIVSSPRVITADRVKAVVEQGTELPYQAKVGNGVSGVQFRRAALKLEVEPQITPHGHVTWIWMYRRTVSASRQQPAPRLIPSTSRRAWRWRTAARWQSAGYILPMSATMSRGSRCSVKSRYWAGFFVTLRAAIHAANWSFSLPRISFRRVCEGRRQAVPTRQSGPFALKLPHERDQNRDRNQCTRKRVGSRASERERIFCRTHGGWEDHRGAGGRAPVTAFFH